LQGIFFIMHQYYYQIYNHCIRINKEVIGLDQFSNPNIIDISITAQSRGLEQKRTW